MLKRYPVQEQTHARFLRASLPAWVLLGATPASAHDLVRAPCAKVRDEVWRNWPTVDNNVLERGTVMVFNLVSKWWVMPSLA